MHFYESYAEAVTSVCKERKYLANTTGFSLEQTELFVKMIIEHDYTQFYALINDQVLGWCDVVPREQELHAHVGVLGMGVIQAHRGNGIGKALISRAIAHARSRGLERIELEVYESNTVAQHLYQKMGFIREGLKRRAKKLDGEYENIVVMGLI